MTPLTPTSLSGIALSALLMTTGCAGYGQSPASAPQGSGTAPVTTAPPAAPCNAKPAQGAVGQSATASVMEAARVRSGAQIARILRPGQMVTKEFNAQRLNLEVDANGRILAVTCG